MNSTRKGPVHPKSFLLWCCWKSPSAEFQANLIAANEKHYETIVSCKPSPIGVCKHVSACDSKMVLSHRDCIIISNLGKRAFPNYKKHWKNKPKIQHKWCWFTFCMSSTWNPTCTTWWLVCQLWQRLCHRALLDYPRILYAGTCNIQTAPSCICLGHHFWVHLQHLISLNSACVPPTANSHKYMLSWDRSRRCVGFSGVTVAFEVNLRSTCASVIAHEVMKRILFSLEQKNMFAHQCFKLQILVWQTSISSSEPLYAPRG